MKRILSILITVVMSAGIFQFEACVSSQGEKNYQSHPVVTSNIIPKGYNDLFKPVVKDHMKLMISYQRKLKDTVSNFLYDNQYIIQIYMLSGKYNLSLKNAVKETYVNNTIEVGTDYYYNQRSMVNISDKMILSKRDVPKQLYFSLYGKNARTVIKTDSLIDYYLDLKNLSIKYQVNGPQEFFANVYKSDSSIPLEIVVLNTKGKLYLLFMSPLKGSKLPQGMLYNLIDNASFQLAGQVKQ